MHVAVGSAVEGLPSSERVYRGIKAEILSGALTPDARLVELRLAARYAVSRTPVREAIKRLTAEGLVALDSVRGMVVRNIDPSEAEDIYLIREMLDGLAARLAAQRATESDVAKLRLLTELMTDAMRDGRWETVVQLNLKFHEVLYHTARNERLFSLSRSLQDTVRRYSTMAFAVPGRVESVIHEHGAIVDAIATADPDRAETITRQHMVQARKNLSHMLVVEAIRDETGPLLEDTRVTR